MLTLYDLASGDTVTSALLDSIAARHAHALHHQAAVSTTAAAPLAQPVQAALVLLDQPRQRLAVVGPFPDHTAALRWEPATFPDADVDCLIVPMHVGVTVAPAVGEQDGGHD